MTDKPDQAIEQSEQRPVTIITAKPNSQYYWKEVWHCRDLMLLLVWRDILVRYKQTIFGVAWAVLRPIVTMIVFTVIFGRLAKLPSHNVPYPLMVFAAVVAWQFFANTFADASNSVVSNANMISKVYFPRIISPLSSLVTGLVDFAITLVLFAGLALWFHFIPDWHLIFLPLFVMLLFLFVLSVSVWTSAFNVVYRDFRFIVPFVIQLGSYLTPVGFSTAIVPEKWQILYSLNPLVGIIGGFRWALLRGTPKLNVVSLVIAFMVTIVLLLPGVKFFIRRERQFADVI